MKNNVRVIALRGLAAFVLGSAAVGCASTAPLEDQELSTSIQRATGLADAIQFRVEQEPVDVSESGAEVLTLAESVRRTLRHSPEVQSALARVRAAQAEAKQARLLPNPIVSVVFRWPQGGGSPEVEAGLAADLVSLLSRPGRIGAADNRLRAAAAEALSRVLDVLAETQRTYVAVQTLDEAVGVVEQRLQIVERLLQLARDRLNFGEGTRLDVLTLQTQQVELRTELAEQRLARREQRLALARLLGQPGGEAEWQVSPWEPYRGPFIPEPRWIALGLEHRPELLATRYELAALGAELRLTRWAPFDGAALGVEAERADGEWAVGPAVSSPIPIFDFGQARRAQARARLMEARHELTRLQRQVVEETRQAHAAFQVTRENLQRVRNMLIPLLEQRHEQAEAQFKAGQIDITGLLIAEQELRAARTRLVELERRNTEALIRLQRSIGGPGMLTAATEGETTTMPATAPASGDAARTPTTRPGQ